MQNQHTLEDLKAQRQTVLAAMKIVGIPADEWDIYQETVRSIDAQIAAMSRPMHQHIQNNSTRPKPEASPLEGGRGVNNHNQPINSRTILAGGHAKTTQPITSKIELANNSDQFNPTITITWSDGYQIPVDETAAIGRFKSTFRDTLALKCVSEGRTEKMWRWDTPWRAAGFYDAITTMRNGIKPTLKDLGYTHPSEKQREIFALITQAFSREVTNF